MKAKGKAQVWCPQCSRHCFSSMLPQKRGGLGVTDQMNDGVSTLVSDCRLQMRSGGNGRKSHRKAVEPTVKLLEASSDLALCDSGYDGPSQAAKKSQAKARGEIGPG